MKMIAALGHMAGKEQSQDQTPGFLGPHFMSMLLSLYNTALPSFMTVAL
jgi:hypothetical protein